MKVKIHPMSARKVGPEGSGEQVKEYVTRSKQPTITAPRRMINRRPLMEFLDAFRCFLIRLLISLDLY